MTPRSEKLALAVLVTIFVLLAAAYNTVTPPTGDQHNPDEGAHTLYVQTLAAGHVPVFHPNAPNYEAHQPPLYYALCVPVYALTRGQDSAVQTHAMRWISTILGALLIVTAWATIRSLALALPADLRQKRVMESCLPLACAGLIALLPMNISLCASLSNDALANLICALVLLCIVRMVQVAQFGSEVYRNALFLGLTLGAGIWTKTSTLVLWPSVLLACYLLLRCKRLSTKDSIQAGAVSLGLGTLIGLPWLIRNQILYGDPVAQHVFLSAFGNTAQAADFVRALGWPIYLVIVAQWTFASFWGVFDSMRLFWGQGLHTPSPLSLLPPLYGVLGIATIAALVGIRGYLRTNALSATQKACLWTFGALTLFTGLAHLRFILTYFQAQGRYDYPALVPLTFFFAAGWQSLCGRTYPRVLLLMGLSLLALNLYTAGFLLPARFVGQ